MLVQKKCAAAALFALLAIFPVAARGKSERSAKEAALSFSGGDVIAVREGTLQGFAKDGALHWLGVPYAAPPAGDLRWEAPRPAETWEGIRNAAKAESAGQMGLLDGAIALVGSEAGAATLGITRPATAEANLPILFYIYGGNNQNGDGTFLPATRFAQDVNCVAVSANHRLGILGFIALPALKKGAASGTEDGATLPKEGFETRRYSEAPILMANGASEFSGFCNGSEPFASLSPSELMAAPDMLAQFRFAEKCGSLMYGYSNGEESAERMLKAGFGAPIYTCIVNWGKDPAIVGEEFAAIFGSRHCITTPHGGRRHASL